jgi:hypothetical protein
MAVLPLASWPHFQSEAWDSCHVLNPAPDAGRFTQLNCLWGLLEFIESEGPTHERFDNTQTPAMQIAGKAAST